MSWFKSDPKLPPGDVGRLLVGNTFSFHSSAQSVVLDSLSKYPNSPIIRTKVINRDVALVLDYDLAKDIVTGEGFSHREAYKQLLAAFFPEPNILLEDDGDETDRPQWRDHMNHFLTNLPELGDIISRHVSTWDSVDIYEACKDLSHEIVFYLFLGIDSCDSQFDKLIEETDTALHGQFSAPVRIGFRGYESTYSKGLQAQTRLNEMVLQRVSSGCPFSLNANIPKRSLESHTSMFSSSLVIKALASYLTFAILQFSRSPDSDIDHLLLETERLGSPIIGLLRKLTQPWAPNSLNIPAGWDAWVYFPLINRSSVFGADPRLFNPKRWEQDLPQPLTFGGGDRICLGRGLMRRVVKEVLQKLDGKLTIGAVEPSVQDFLGWQLGDNTWPRIKQLPVQRPRDPIIIHYKPQVPKT